MAGQRGCTFKDPGSLKEILELLASLNSTVIFKQKVADKLVDGIGQYCNNISKIYQSSDSGSSGFLLDVFKQGQLIRVEILQSSGTYGNYNNILSHGSHPECIKKYAEALNECLPKAFSALYYLYFNCDVALKSTIQGGDWSDHTCDGRNDQGQNLNKWLTDQGDKGTSTQLVRRGFPNETSDLSEHIGKDVANQIKSIITHDSAGPFQSVLLYLMFACKWDPSLLGHALLFLHYFCSKVNEDPKNAFRETFQRTYTSNDSDTFKELCQQLKLDLDSLVNVSDPGIQAVCQQNQKLFEEIWDDNKFRKYCEWLSTNLGQIIASLQEMLQDSEKWGLSSLTDASSAGPFKYGFVPKDSGWENGIKEKLQGCISKLTGGDSGSLDKLKKYLKVFSALPVQPSRVLYSHVPSAGRESSSSGSSEHSQTGRSQEDSPGESSGPSTTSIVGASVGTLGGTAALGGLGYFLRGFLFGV